MGGGGGGGSGGGAGTSTSSYSGTSCVGIGTLTFEGGSVGCEKSDKSIEGIEGGAERTGDATTLGGSASWVDAGICGDKVIWCDVITWGAVSICGDVAGDGAGDSGDATIWGGNATWGDNETCGCTTTTGDWVAIGCCVATITGWDWVTTSFLGDWTTIGDCWGLNSSGDVWTTWISCSVSSSSSASGWTYIIFGVGVGFTISRVESVGSTPTYITFGVGESCLQGLFCLGSSLFLNCFCLQYLPRENVFFPKSSSSFIICFLSLSSFDPGLLSSFL